MPSDPGRDPRRPTVPPPTRTGFSARLQGATLFDLIQFECLQRTRRAVRVSDGARTGYLFFRDGNVVHATEGRQIGEPAVRAMLRWSQGAFDVCQAPWPERESITGPWQMLLMTAAQAQDEGDGTGAGARPPNVLSFPVREPGGKGDDDVTVRTETAPQGPPVQVVRLAARGEVLAGGPTDLADAAAYAAQLADIAAELLGLERFASLELTLSDGACLVRRERDGGLVAARASRDVDPALLWQAVGR